MGTRELKKSRKPIPRKAKVTALATCGVAVGFLVQPLFAAAETSAPLPPDVDPTTTSIDVTSGTTVRVANAALTLVTTSDKSVVTPGSTVTYKYVLTDTGNTAFKNVKIEDDKCSPISAWTGNDSDPLLNIGEVWTATCKTTVLKDQTNKAKVTATPVLSDVVVTPSATPTPTQTAAGLKDGTYLGTTETVVVPGESISYPIQVQAVIAGGRITSITVPTFGGTDPTSRNIGRFQVATQAALNNDPANPTMIYEALQAQSAQIATVSGATFTTKGFKDSLAAALISASA